MPKLDIVALGEPLYEFNQQADGNYRPGFGGDTSNMAIAASRLGARVAYATQVGDDSFGDALMQLWRREDVETARVRRLPNSPTGMYFVSHSEAGHRFDYRREGSAASRMRPEDFPASQFADTHWLHVSAVSQAISATATDTVLHAIAAARAASARISYDTNLRLRLWPLPRARAIIAATAIGVDVLKTSLDDAQILLGIDDPQAVADAYLAGGAKAVAVTLGAHGALVADASGSFRIAPQPVSAVDATGAGDAFAGAFIAELQRNTSLADAARFANAAAALATTGYGAVAPLPSRAAVLRLLEQTTRF